MVQKKKSLWQRSRSKLANLFKRSSRALKRVVLSPIRIAKRSIRNRQYRKKHPSRSGRSRSSWKRSLKRFAAH